MAKVTSAVWQPPTDGPAGRDFDVRVALARQALVRERIPRRWSKYVFLALVCLAAGLPVSSALSVAAALVLTAVMLRYWQRVGRSLPDVRQLLAAEPARLIDYEPVSGRLVRVDGMVLRLHRGYRKMPLWLIGPNVDGLAVAFYGANPTPRVVRVVAKPPRRSSPPPVPLALSPLRLARRMAVIVGATFTVRWAFIVAVTVSIGLELRPQPSVLGWMFAAAGVVITGFFARSWQQLWPLLRLPRLLAAPLVEHPARALPKRSVAVTLADGVELIGKYLVHLDVQPSVRTSGRLWIAGTPAAGATVGVGVPGFAIAGLVRFDQGGTV